MITAKRKLELIVDGVTSALAEAWVKTKASPTRQYIVEQIRAEHPELNHPRLDLEVARFLQYLIKTRKVQRREGKFYAPGEVLCESEEPAHA